MDSAAAERASISSFTYLSRWLFSLGRDETWGFVLGRKRSSDTGWQQGDPEVRLQAHWLGVGSSVVSRGQRDQVILVGSWTSVVRQLLGISRLTAHPLMGVVCQLAFSLPAFENITGTELGEQQKFVGLHLLFPLYLPDLVTRSEGLALCVSRKLCQLLPGNLFFSE